METIPRLTIEIDPILKAKFKSKTAAESTDMKHKVEEWIEKYIAGEIE